MATDRVSHFEYTSSDRTIWEEELEEFVPKRLFDAHIHLWSEDHLPAEDPRRGTYLPADMEQTRTLNEVLFPGRRIEYLVLGTPCIGVDVDAHNRFVAAEIASQAGCRAHRLVTPACRLDAIRADLDERGFTGLKPYRLFASSGDVNRCRIHEFLTHEQMELANDRGLWVTMHLSRYDGCADEENLRDLEEYTTRRYPRIRWILAHCARSFTYWPIRQAVARLRELPNIWYDCSAVTEVLPHYTLFAEEDHRRILYGSDNLLANAFRGKYAALGRFWYQMEPPAIASEAEIHTDQRPILSIYEQLLAMKHAASLAGLSRDQIEDVFCRNAAAAFHPGGR